MSEGRTIRSLLVRLGVKTDEKAVASFNGSINAARSFMFRAAAAAAALTAGVLATAAAMWTAAGAAADHAENLKQTAETLGVTTDELQELRHVFDQFPLGTEGALRTLNRLNLSLGNFRKGSGEASEGFRLLNLRAKDFDGLGLPDVLEKIADGYLKQSDGQKRLLAVQRIFGDELAARVAPALAKGAAGIDELRMAARSLGLVLDQETIDRLNRVKGQMQAVRGVAANLAYRFSAAIAPAVDVATESFLRWYEANADWIQLKFEGAARIIQGVMDRIGRAFADADRWVRENLGGWEQAFTQAAKLIVALGMPAIFVGITIAAAAMAATVAPILAGISTPFLVLAAAAAMVAAGIAGMILIGEDLYQWIQGGDSVWGRYLEWLGVNEEALATYRGALTAVRDVGMAFVEAIDAMLLPLGGLSGMATGAAGALLSLFRVVVRFLSQNIGMPALRAITGGLRILEALLDSVASKFRSFPTLAGRVGESMQMAGRLFGMPGADKQPAGFSAAFSALGDRTSPPPPTVQPRAGDTITIDAPISITEPGASADEIREVVRTELGGRLRRARDIGAGVDR